MGSLEKEGNTVGLCDSYTNGLLQNILNSGKNAITMKNFTKDEEYLMKFIYEYASDTHYEENITINDVIDLIRLDNKDERKNLIAYYESNKENKYGYSNSNKWYDVSSYQIFNKNRRLLEKFINCLRPHTDGGRPSRMVSKTSKTKTRAQRKKSRTFKPRHHHRRRTTIRRRRMN